MHERFSQEELAHIHHFFPESDILEQDLRLLSIIEVARLKGLYTVMLELLHRDVLSYVRLSLNRPSIPPLLWLLRDVRPTTITRGDKQEIARAYTPEKETPRAAGLMEHPTQAVGVVSIEERKTKAPRALVFYALAGAQIPYRNPLLQPVSY